MRWSLCALALLVGAFVGCAAFSGDGPDGGAGGAGGCPNDLPGSCPADPPSYQRDVVPVLERHCLSCHSSGGQEATQPLDTYQAVHDRRSAVLDQVYACRMPPAGEPALPVSDRQTLLKWLVCRAPDN